MRKGLRGESAFTLTELLVTVIITGIVSSAAFIGYQYYLSRTHIMTCEMNQRVLATAVRLHAMNRGFSAKNLTELPVDCINRAYAEVLREGRPAAMLVHLDRRLREWDLGPAVAEACVGAQYYAKQIHLIRCPADSTPPADFEYDSVEDDWHVIGGDSYAYPSVSDWEDSPRAKPFSWFLDPANAAKTLIVECENEDGTPLAKRHMGNGVATRVDGTHFLQ